MEKGRAPKLIRGSLFYIKMCFTLPRPFVHQFLFTARIGSKEPCLQDRLRLEVLGYLFCHYLCAHKQKCLFPRTKLQMIFITCKLFCEKVICDANRCTRENDGNYGERLRGRSERTCRARRFNVSCWAM